MRHTLRAKCSHLLTYLTYLKKHIPSIRLGNAFPSFGFVNPNRVNKIHQHTLVYPERSTLRFLHKVRTSRIEKYLVKFQFVRLRERIFGQCSRLGMSLPEFIRFDPVFKVLPRFPKCKHDVGSSSLTGRNTWFEMKPGMPSTRRARL